MGRFGHELLEFELQPDGRLRYANNSNYKKDTMIKKEVMTGPAVQKEMRRIIEVRLCQGLARQRCSIAFPQL